MYELILQNIKKYIELNEEEIHFFTSKLEFITLNKKELLLSAGEHCSYVCFVNKGCLRSYSTAKDGTEHIVQFAIEDYWISDLYSFLSGLHAVYNIEAIEYSELLKISKDSLEEVYSTHPKFERFFRLLVEKSYVATQQRIISSLSESAEEKYTGMIAKWPKIINRIPQQYLASYLGITPESFSRMKKKLLKN